MIEKWLTTKNEFAADLKIFQAYWVRRHHPVLNKEGRFVVLESPKWVNIIPITSDNKVLLIEQYRHGTDEVTIEVPGGLVEPGEDTRIAAERECMEETGYKGTGDSVLLGESHPNPAFLNNHCWSYVWFGCKLNGEQKLDRHEDIEVMEVPLQNIRHMINEGKINHSLVLDAFLYYSLKFGWE
jgi:8-oxo-dGTP pyrophosphatase MutT (NUDIX family)